MPRSGITYEEVEAVAERLTAAGENPTIQRVRTELGTGSPNTIHRHLSAWREAVPSREKRVVELPAELQAAIVREIERQKDEDHAFLIRKVNELTAEAVELSRAGEGLEKELGALKSRNIELEATCKRLKALAGDRAQEIVRLEQELEEGEKIKAQLAQALSRQEIQAEQMEKQQGHISSLEAQLDEAKAVSVKAKQEAAVAVAKQEAAEREARRLTALLKEQKGDYESRLAEQVAGARKREEALESLIKEIRAESGGWQAEARRREQAFEVHIKEIRKEYQAQVAALKKELEDNTHATLRAQGQAAELRGKLDALAAKKSKSEKI